MFNHGISKEGGLVDLGVAEGIVKKAGAFFTYGETKLGQGRENTKIYLSEHPEVALQIERQIRASMASPGSPITEETNPLSQG
jgi:recombination protein RecA